MSSSLVSILIKESGLPPVPAKCFSVLDAKTYACKNAVLRNSIIKCLINPHEFIAAHNCFDGAKKLNELETYQFICDNLDILDVERASELIKYEHMNKRSYKISREMTVQIESIVHRIKILIGADKLEPLSMDNGHVKAHVIHHRTNEIFIISLAQNIPSYTNAYLLSLALLFEKVRATMILPIQGQVVIVDTTDVKKQIAEIISNEVLHDMSHLENLIYDYGMETIKEPKKLKKSKKLKKPIEMCDFFNDVKKITNDDITLKDLSTKLISYRKFINDAIDKSDFVNNVDKIDITTQPASPSLLYGLIKYILEFSMQIFFSIDNPYVDWDKLNETDSKDIKNLISRGYAQSANDMYLAYRLMIATKEHSVSKLAKDRPNEITFELVGLCVKNLRDLGFTCSGRKVFYNNALVSFTKNNKNHRTVLENLKIINTLYDISPKDYIIYNPFTFEGTRIKKNEFTDKLVELLPER